MNLPDSADHRRPHPWTGRLLLGRYRFTGQLLGSGGMGDVYRGHDENLGINVVVKVPKMHLLGGAKGIERFRKEIHSLLALSHPHIVKIEAVGIEEGAPYAVMQYLERGSLHSQRRMIHHKLPKPDFFEPLGTPAIGRWLRQVAEALDFIHHKGFVHRDVKPGNILFDSAGNAYLSDFGVIKAIRSAQEETEEGDLTSIGTVPGTAAYFAPELLTPLAEPSAASDQYALATTVFELIAGRRPFLVSKFHDGIRDRQRAAAPDLRAVYRTVPPGLAAALAGGLATDPLERYPSCTAFADAVLSGIAEGAADQRIPASATLACAHCSELLLVEIRLTIDAFTCPQCGGQLVSDPRLAWVEPAPDDDVAVQKRIDELRANRRRSSPPSIPEQPPPRTQTPWPDGPSPPSRPPPFESFREARESDSPVIDTGNAATKKARREHQREQKRKRQREELWGVVSIVVMLSIALVAYRLIVSR